MSIARSGIGWMIARLGALAITWLASLYFARALVDPQSTLGTYYAFETVVAFLVLFANAGLNGAIIKRLTEGQDVPELASAGLILSGILALFFSLVVVLAAPHLENFFGFGGLSVLILIAALVAYQVRDMLNSILTSNFQIGRSGVVDFVNAAGQVGTQVILILAGFGALALMAGYMAGAIVAAVVSILLVFRSLELARPSRRHFQSLLSFARYSFLNNFVHHFYDNIDIIVITILLGKAATGVYGIGFKFSLILTVFYSAINRASSPEISKHDAEGDKDRIREVLSDSIVLGLLIGLPAFAGFLVLARPIILTFYTEAFAAATIVAVGAVATRIPEGLRGSFGTVLNGIDRPDIVFRGGVILMMTNVILDILLVPSIGVVGAVVASFLGMALQVLYMGYHLVSLLDLSWADFPIQDVSREVVASIIMAGIVLAAQTFVNPFSFIRLSALVGLGVAVYFATVLVVAPAVRSRVVAILGDVLHTT